MDIGIGLVHVLLYYLLILTINQWDFLFGVFSYTILLIYRPVSYSLHPALNVAGLFTDRHLSLAFGEMS